MIALFALLGVLAWVALSGTVSFALAKRVVRASGRWLLGLSLWAALLPLPVIDELIGASQFRRLCRENQHVQIAVETARGRTVSRQASPSIRVEGTFVPVFIQPWRYIDANTSELVVTYNTLSAGAGWLARTSRLSEGGTPLTFSGSCLPKDAPMSKKAFSRLGITLIDSPTSNAKIRDSLPRPRPMA